MKKIFLGLMFVSSLAKAQINQDSIFIKQISNEVLQNGEAYKNLFYLTKKIGNRLSGSENFNKAVQWGKQVMQQSGASNVFLQPCTIPNWKRGAKESVSVVSINGKPKAFSLNVLALGNSLGNAKTIIAPVIAVKNFEELEKRKEEIKGKIVFFNYAFNDTHVETFKAYGDAGKYRRSGASVVAKYGGLAIIVRSLSHSVDNHPHTGSMTYNDSFPKIAAVAIGLQHADSLYKWTQQSKLVLSYKTNCYFDKDAIGYNVIGKIKGTEFPNKYITIGGHLDSWDVGEGAHDDGAGCVQTIEVLRTLVALNYKPKHSIRFVLFANEENGLKGGKEYANQAKLNNEEHVFALESDAGGFTPRGFGFTIGADKLQKIQTWLPLLKPYGTEFLRMGGGGADIGPLNEAFKTPLAGLSPDSQRYFDFHHAINDVFEAVNKRELLLGAVNMTALVYLVDKYGL